MTDTDLLHMAALEARLTEAENMLDRAEMLLYRSKQITDNDAEEAFELRAQNKKLFRGGVMVWL